MNEAPLEIIGLLTLAKAHNAALHTIEKELIRITGEKDQYGHSGDAVWDHIDRLSAPEVAAQLWERTKQSRV